MAFIDESVRYCRMLVGAALGAHQALKGEVPSPGHVPNVQGQVVMANVREGRQRVEVLFMMEVERVMDEDAQVALLRANPWGAFTKGARGFLRSPPVFGTQRLGSFQDLGVRRGFAFLGVQQRGSRSFQ
jgi:hypothetical protein